MELSILSVCFLYPLHTRKNQLDAPFLGCYICHKVGMCLLQNLVASGLVFGIGDELVPLFFNR